MKLTWFSGSSFRVHIGGQILVIDAEGVAAGVDRTELVSGADDVVRLGDERPLADGRSWVPRARQRLVDAGDGLRPLQAWSVGSDSLLIDADDDMPLLVLVGDVPELGRWVEKAVVVVAGQGLAERAGLLMDRARPRLIALAGDEGEVGAAFASLRDRLDGTGLIALEPGLAVEV